MFATVKRTFSEFSEDNGTDWAAALTYYAVLSLFPAIAALVALVGLVMDPQTLTQKLTAIVSELGPSSAVQSLQGPIQSIAASNSTGLVVLIAGLLGSLWTASGYVGAFMRASNQIYEVPEGREFYKLRPLQMLITLVILLLVALVLIALVVSGPVAAGIGRALGVGSVAVTVYQYAKWPILALLVMVILAVLYYSTPNARLPKFTLVTPGAILALVVWVLASVAFAFYVANFGSYNKTYGALGGVIVFLIWLWITNIAVLLGQELNSERERGKQLAAGLPAEDRLQFERRDEPKEKQLPDTAQGGHAPPDEMRDDAAQGGHAPPDERRDEESSTRRE